MNWLRRIFRALGLCRPGPSLPAPFRTHGCANFWYAHACPHDIGTEIVVRMESGRLAAFKLVKREAATGVDWYWYEFEFVRYLQQEAVVYRG